MPFLPVQSARNSHTYATVIHMRQSYMCDSHTCAYLTMSIAKLYLDKYFQAHYHDFNYVITLELDNLITPHTHKCRLIYIRYLQIRPGPLSWFWFQLYYYFGTRSCNYHTQASIHKCRLIPASKMHRLCYYFWTQSFHHHGSVGALSKMHLKMHKKIASKTYPQMHFKTKKMKFWKNHLCSACICSISITIIGVLLT